MADDHRKEESVQYTQVLKSKADLHIARKLWHFLGVMMITIIYWTSPRVVSMQLITFFSFLFIIIDLLRHQLPIMNRFFTKYLRFVMRDYEKNGMAGISYLMLGCFLVMYYFPKNVVTLSLLFLAIADPFASYIGILYEKTS